MCKKIACSLTSILNILLKLSGVQMSYSAYLPGPRGFTKIFSVASIRASLVREAFVNPQAARWDGQGSDRLFDFYHYMQEEYVLQNYVNTVQALALINGSIDQSFYSIIFYFQF